LQQKNQKKIEKISFFCQKSLSNTAFSGKKPSPTAFTFIFFTIQVQIKGQRTPRKISAGIPNL